MVNEEEFNRLLTASLRGDEDAVMRLWKTCCWLSREQIQAAIHTAEISHSNPEAMVVCGILYEANRDYERAIRHYENALERGNATAMILRSEMCLIGMGGAVNHKRAFELCDRAIALGSTGAMMRRAWWHRHSTGGPVDDGRANGLYDRAMALGNTDAMMARAWMHRQGDGGPVDYGRANECYDRAIAQGVAKAMVERAWMHLEGNGGPVDYERAIELYDRAIALDHCGAMIKRAWMHRHGMGGAVNYGRAIELYNRAIAFGYGPAMYERASMHAMGQGGEVDLIVATKLFYRHFKQEPAGERVLIHLSEKGVNEASVRLFMIYAGVSKEPQIYIYPHRAVYYFNQSQTACCDKIQAKLDSRGSAHNIGQLLRVAHYAVSKGPIEIKHRVWYLHLQYLLNEGREEDAYNLNQERLPSEYPLNGDICLRLASFLIGRIDDEPESGVDMKAALRQTAMRFLYRGYQSGDQNAHNLLVHMLREQRAVQQGKPRGAYLEPVFFGEHNAVALELSDPETTRLIENFSKDFQEQKEAMIAAQMRHITQHRLMLQNENSRRNYFHRFFTSLGVNSERAQIDEMITRLSTGNCLSDIVKEFTLSQIPIVSRLRTFIEKVLTETRDVDPNRLLILKEPEDDRSIFRASSEAVASVETPASVF